MCLNFVKTAREQGLKAPVVLMGQSSFTATLATRSAYSRIAGLQDTSTRCSPTPNPSLSRTPRRTERTDSSSSISRLRRQSASDPSVPRRGEQLRLSLCFRNSSPVRNSMSYIPLIAPSTTDARIKFLASIADSFIYVVSKMGTTGATTSVSTSLSSLLIRIRSLLPSPIPLAVGFGVSTQAHFEEVGQNADGVVIGSQLVSVIKAAAAKQEDPVAAVQTYCAHVSSGKPRSAISASTEALAAPILAANEIKEGMKALPARFGDFGGAYVPEALFDCLAELSSAYSNARADPAFWKEWEGEFGYMNRPSQLYEATRLSEHAGGAKIWFKREDLNHTGSHKVRLSHLLPRTHADLVFAD